MLITLSLFLGLALNFCLHVFVSLCCASDSLLLEARRNQAMSPCFQGQGME